ncbi:MAG: Uma2 family endonuclease [Planctomycetota bacterium]|nr:Uma2 family endonuclease [Planctomycetota bacterium]
MSPAIAETLTEWTAADLVERFGPIRLHRIRSHPAPGTATEQDVIDIHDREDRLFELVDGVLVEKAMGTHESVLAVALSALLRDFVKSTKSGFVLGADGMARLAPGLIRIPDVSFVSWDQLPNKIIPAGPMLDFAPRLAVEILSASNTKREMDQKLVDYFEAGVELVWYVDPRARTVKVHSSPASFIVLDVGQTLAGGAVLPGFSVAVKDLFAELETSG